MCGWEPLVCPIVRTFGGRLWQQLTGPPPQPALRLTASAQLCGVDLVQDTDAGLPVELAKSKLGAADNLILTGHPVGLMGLCTEQTGGLGLYSALVFDNTLLQMPRRDQQSTLSSSPQLLPTEALHLPPLISKPRADSPSLAVGPVQQLPEYISSHTETPAPVSGTEMGSGSGNTMEQTVLAQSVELLNHFPSGPWSARGD